jgi:hypothetical protein
MTRERVEAADIRAAPPNYHLLVDAGPRLALSTVQEPGTAQSAAMILSALERLDLVLDLEGIAELLNGMCSNEPLRRT